MSNILVSEETEILTKITYEINMLLNRSKNGDTTLSPNDKLETAKLMKEYLTKFDTPTMNVIKFDCIGCKQKVDMTCDLGCCKTCHGIGKCKHNRTGP